MSVFGLLVIPLIEIFNSITERILGASELPGKDVSRFIGVRNNGWITPSLAHPIRSWGPVEADQPILTPHLPVIVVGVAMMPNASEQTFGPGTVAGLPVLLFDRDEVFRSRKDESV